MHTNLLAGGSLAQHAARITFHPPPGTPVVRNLPTKKLPRPHGMTKQRGGFHFHQQSTDHYGAQLARSTIPAGRSSFQNAPTITDFLKKKMTQKSALESRSV
jgi:hypothetical protein